jgi:hypothetical protein
MVSQGETAYVRGPIKGEPELQVFRSARPLTDPSTSEVLGFEGVYVGTAAFRQPGEERVQADKSTLSVPASVVMTSVRQEAGVGDRLVAMAPRDFDAYMPHAPATPLRGQIVSVYGDALNAGQNQIVALNRGAKDGVERGHVLGLWRDGALKVDSTDDKRPTIKLPDEPVGMIFVFRVFDRVSYALILRATEPVRRGDRFTPP